MITCLLLGGGWGGAVISLLNEALTNENKDLDKIARRSAPG